MDDFANQNKHPPSGNGMLQSLAGGRVCGCNILLLPCYGSTGLFLWSSNWALFHIPKSTMGNSFCLEAVQVWISEMSVRPRLKSPQNLLLPVITALKFAADNYACPSLIHFMLQSCSSPQSSPQSRLRILRKLYVYMPHLRTKHDLRYCCVFDLSL